MNTIIEVRKLFLIFVFVLIFLFLNQDSQRVFLYDNSGRKINVVIIDPGHGGKDPGAISLSGAYEKDVNLSVSLKLRDLLIKEYDDIEVILTRETDEFIELRERGRIANSNRGDLFISIHCNARKSVEHNKSGFELYLLSLARLDEAAVITSNENRYLIPTKKDSIVTKYIPNKIISSLTLNSNFKNSERFAFILQSEMGKGINLPSRGFFQAGFLVLVGASMPSVLVECGYLTNEDDEEYLISDEGQNEIAKSIYKAIRYFKFDYDFENSFLIEMGK